MNKIVNATDTLIPAPKDGQDGKPGQPGRPGTDGKPGPAGPSYYPAGKFDINREYERTSFHVPFVEHDSQYYYLNKVGKFKGIDPAKDYAANGKNATWVLGDKIKLAIIEAVVAEFGKIASAVFWRDFMLSQYGIDAEGKPVETADGYKAFTPGMDNFTPNILLNFLTGYAHFAKGNVKFNEDGSVDIIGSVSSSDKNTNIKLNAKTNSITMTSEGREVMTLSFEEMADSIGFRPFFKMIGPINRLTGSLPTINIRPNGISLVIKGNRGYNLEFTLNGEGLFFKKEKLTAEGLVLSSRTTSYPAPANW